MKRIATLALAAASVAALAAGSAQAQPGWQSVNQRQANLDARIDQGVRNGSLTRAEALRLRAEFRDVAALEDRYRANGLSAWERQDLDRRFDSLSTQIRYERRDRDDRNDRGWYGGRGWNDDRGTWMNVNQRQRELDRRIDAGVRSGRLTRAEAATLRSEYQSIASLEARYRRNGLNATERAELDRRFDRLALRIRYEATDNARYSRR